MHKLAILSSVLICVMVITPSVGNYVVTTDKVAIEKQPKHTIVASSYHSYSLSIQEDTLTILSPRSTIPVIVRQNEAFMITVALDAPSPTWQISISTAYDLVTERFELPVVDSAFNVETGQWDITALVSRDVSTELYNLTVKATFGDMVVEAEIPRAVSVVYEYKSTFSFVHLTDFHIGDPRGFTVDVNRTIGWKAAKKSIDEINLLKPDFVLISGDLVFGQLYPLEYAIEYPQCYDILQRFQVPTYLAPGNHDGYIQFGQDGFEFWERYFGPRYYSFDYGPYHFTAVNSYDWPDRSRWAFSYLAFNWGGNIGTEQLAWLEADAQSNTDAPLTFMFMHHNPLWDTVNDSLLKNGYAGREELLSIINRHGIDAVLAGHVHWDDVTWVNDTLFLTTTTVSSGLSADDAYWGYRLITVVNNTFKSFSYKESKYSIPLYRLNATFDNNDGTSTTVTGFLENDLNIDVTVCFPIYVPEGSYSVDYGDIVDIHTDGNILKIIIETVLPARSETHITVYPV